MHINYEWYRVFYEVAHSGQISIAARHLFITQPAVSQSIKQLEAVLGGRLFLRTSRGMELTTEGQVLFQYIEKAHNLIRQGESRYQEMQDLETGQINVGASDTLCTYFLLPFLEEYHHRYPGIRIKVTNRTTPETIELLKQGQIDLGVVHLPIPLNNQLNVVKADQIENCFVCGEKYRDEFLHAVSLKELIQYPLILLEKGSSTRTFLDKYFQSQGLNLEPEIELGSNDLLADFTRIGLGISFVHKQSVLRAIEEGQLFEIRLRESLPAQSIGVASLKGIQLSSAGRRFLAMLTDNAKNEGEE